MEERMVRIVREGNYYTIIVYINGAPTYSTTNKYWDLSIETKPVVDALFPDADK